MRLSSVHVKQYKSIWDSNEFSLGDVTCLVGKNESGKTVLLEAIYRLNPIVEEHGTFDVTDDYPRWEVGEYEQRIDAGADHAIVTTAKFTLEQDEVKAIEAQFGEGILTEPVLTLSKGYSNTLYFSLAVAQRVACGKLIADASLPEEVNERVAGFQELAQLAESLSEYIDAKSSEVDAAKTHATQLPEAEERTRAVADAEKLAAAPQVEQLLSRLREIEEDGGLIEHIYGRFLERRVPRFLYFSEYYQMQGQLNIEQLRHRQQTNALLESDRAMLGLVELARLDLDQLTDPRRTEVLVSRLESASNHLSRKILKYWSQNTHLRVEFDVRPANPEDPEGMRTGTNLWGRVFDSVHQVTTLLGTRSRGFLWFFSFLAYFSKESKRPEPLILLLDEPGLSLHAMAQADLLRYVDAELKPHHQVIHSTHSPFMVDPHHFDRVRIVEDKGIDIRHALPPDQKGTKVLSDALQAAPDSLFPLQGALGFDIAQTLFVGPNSLIVEGVSDLLYLQCMTRILEAQGREGLSSDWTITPVGGCDKVPTFVSLLGSQRAMTVATLIDISTGQEQRIEFLYKRKLLKKKNVLTFGDFTGADEADIEDMFAPDVYVKLVNAEYAADLDKPITASVLKHASDRITERLRHYFQTNPLKSGASFNHYRPARYFAENTSSLPTELSMDCLDRFEKAFKALNALL